MRILVDERNNHFSRPGRQETMPRTQRLLDLRPVTTAEFSLVNLATIREGFNHCRWPREVIERFLAVEA